MGAVRRTNQNLEIVRTDVERGLVLIKGAVPGAKGGWVEIRDAVKGHKAEELPVPGKFRMPSADKADKKPAKAKGEEE